MRAQGSPHSTASVGLVAIDDELLSLVRSALSAEALLPSSAVVFDDAVDHLLRTAPNVALVGIDGSPDAAVRFARDMHAQNKELTLIAVARARDADTILTAMRAGFEEFVILPDDAEPLRQAVMRSAMRQAGEAGTGMVVTLIGAKGGVGTTLLATHLAAELAAIHRVLCIDLDFATGDLAPMMDVTPKETLADLLPRAVDADERMLSGHTVVHGSKVHLLCQPDDIDKIPFANTEDVFSVINAAADSYQYVIIDAGSNVGASNEVALRVADHILLVTTPDVVSVRDAYRTLRSLLQHNVDRGHIHIVINKMPKQPYLTAEKIEANVGARVVGIIPDDSRRVDQAVNEGKLIRELHPRAEIVVEIGRLVGLLSDDPADLRSAEKTAKKSGGIFSRLFS